jgi:EF hand
VSFFTAALFYAARSYIGNNSVDALRQRAEAAGTSRICKRFCGARTRRRVEPSQISKEKIMTRTIVLLAATLLSVTAVAGDDKAKKDTTMKSTAATFESLDKNADSQISKTEAAGDKWLSDSFAAADTNGDGYLSKSEYMAREKT